MRLFDPRAIITDATKSTVLDVVARTELSEAARRDVLAGRTGTFKDFLGLFRHGTEVPGPK